MPPGTLYVGRPTIWGNPFLHPDPAEAVAAYRRLIAEGGTQCFTLEPGGLQFARNFHPNCLHWSYPNFVREHIAQLRGFHFACWCPLDRPCHADALLDLANA